MKTIQELLQNPSFKEEIKTAIDEGVSNGWNFEFYIDIATNAVITLLEKYSK